MQILVEKSKLIKVIVLIGVSVFLPGSPPILAQSKKAKLVMKVYVGSNGARHIVHSDGQDLEVPKEKDEVFDSTAPVISDDKHSAGWLVYYDNSCCTSYPIPLMLVIHRPAGPLLRLNGGRMICAWHFLAGGKRVAFYTNTVHGDFAPHYELYNVRTGRLIEKLDGPLDEKSPTWTDGLH